ncbi:MAG: LysR substrate-binding domain-containing protein, partial [Cyanobacteria bacterium J06628_6]
MRQQRTRFIRTNTHQAASLYSYPEVSTFFEYAFALKRYPLVSTSLFFSDRMVDLIDEGFDVVIRIGNLEDSRLIARPIATTELITCASKHYLDVE